jgi:hypothetical protein
VALEILGMTLSANNVSDPKCEVTLALRVEMKSRLDVSSSFMKLCQLQLLLVSHYESLARGFYFLEFSRFMCLRLDVDSFKLFLAPFEIHAGAKLPPRYVRPLERKENVPKLSLRPSNGYFHCQNNNASDLHDAEC